MREFNFDLTDSEYVIPERIQRLSADNKAKKLVLSWFSYFPQYGGYDLRKDSEIDLLSEVIDPDKCIHELYLDKKRKILWVIRPALPFYFARVDLDTGTYTRIDNFAEAGYDEIVESDEVENLSRAVITLLRSLL